MDNIMNNIRFHPMSAAAGGIACLALLGLTGLGGSTHQELKEFLDHFSVEMLEDGQGGLVKTFRLTGVNLQLVNGLGATNGYPPDPTSNDPLVTQTNGLGNLIVGYNEFKASMLPNDRTGSHNVVAGTRLDFSSYGGLVVGDYNAISGPYASVSGGNANRASAIYSSVSGGFNGRAEGEWAAISGGHACTASGEYASVSGGRLNVASGNYASVSGGAFRTASSYDDWVAGTLFEDY
jgi:hypothetical protein